MPRFYLPNLPVTCEPFDLSPEVARHVQVLRLQPGDNVVFFDGKGCEGAGKIVEMSRRYVRATCSDVVLKQATESPLHTVLLQAISSNEHMDYTIQKSVELGVYEVVPVVSERSVKLPLDRAAKKQQRWHDIAIASCAQCGRNVLPMIHEPLTLAGAIARLNMAQRLMLDAATVGAKTVTLPASGVESVALLVGAEGGLTAAEKALALANGFQSLSLGNRILRTETAAVVALSFAQMKWGDFAR